MCPFTRIVSSLLFILIMRLSSPLRGEGRIKNYRDVSSKLIFYDLVQDGEKTQAVVNCARGRGRNLGGSRCWRGLGMSLVFVHSLRDHCLYGLTELYGKGVTGYPGRTKARELSIFATAHLQLLAPSLHTPASNSGSVNALPNRHVDLMIAG